MRVLVIADLHNKVHWVEKCIAEEKPDLTVFLGDYFDSFDETEESPAETARWLKQSLETPKRIHLMGNHDMPYRYPSNMNLFCPGFTHEKSHLINEILGQNTSWKKLHSFHFVDGWLLSHAGIHPSMLYPILGFNVNQLRRDEEAAFSHCAAGMNPPFFGCGRSRGGSFAKGGITWQDFDTDFVPIEGVNQIVGHTPHPQVQAQLLLGNESDERAISCSWEKYQQLNLDEPIKSVNIALDTHRRHYAILQKGKLKIVENQYADEMDFSV